MKVQERLIQYCKIHTASNPHTKTVPSTACQLDLAKLLVEQMKELGIEDAHVSEFGVVYGTILSNVDYKTDTVGLIAHMDTSPEYSGENVKPRLVENYDGKDIVLNPEVILKVSDFPDMSRFVGKDLIVTDGTTLLGADDKAGIAEIMTLAQILHEQPEIKHGTIKLAFTPDEEIGEGADHFDVEHFQADYAFTLDGGAPEEYCLETFNAATAVVEVTGVSIHPGSAKNIMINAINVAMEFHQCLPVFMRPEHTESFEGFNHVHEFNGTTESAKMEYIIRNHDAALFDQQIELFSGIEALINQKYGQQVVKVTILPSYRNMKEVLVNQPQIIDLLKESIEAVGLTPISRSARGGTDGSRLTFMGLPCPNIGTGGANCHGRYEVACVQEMETIVEILLKMIEKIAK